MNTNSNKIENYQCTKRSFSYDEVKKIAHDVINLGMALRQDQLNGFSDKSGNDVLKEYMDSI